MKIAKNLTQLIGNTPLMDLEGYCRQEGISGVRLTAKLESFNPLSSAKDRVGLALIEDAERRGLIQKGAVLIEPTSGNTGIGLAYAATIKGYKLILTMPDTMSAERRGLLAALGAQLVLTPGKDGMAGAIAKANALHDEIPGSYIPGQFVNPANPQAHYETTGPEIWRDTDGKVDIFVAGVGTGGTITGVARALKEKNPKVRIVGVEPSDSAVLSGKPAGPHPLQGIGAGFVPEILDRSLLDEVIPVTGEGATAACRTLAKTEVLLAGISSGAALHAASLLARREENAGKLIVVLLPDTGERYLSTGLFG